MPLNFDSFSVGIAIAGNLILGSVIFFARKKSATTSLFLALSITLSAWSLVNFFSYQAKDPALALLLVRMVLFFAVPIGTLFLFLADTFPGDRFKLAKNYTFGLTAYSILAMILTLTPAVFEQVVLSPGSAPTPVVGPGIIVFTIVPVLAILFGIVLLIKRTVQAAETEKKPFEYLSLGILIMFGLIIVFNFIFPSFLNNTRFIPLSALFTLPFVALTAYAIFRYHLLNMKIVATEALTFLLTVAMAAEIILSNDLITIIFRFSILLLVIGLGILLIKSVRREVEQREQLQALTKQLADANNKLQVLDQARAEFISIASHQLRTPPATVKWYLSAILSGDYGKLSKEVKPIVEKTAQTNNHLISLIEDMLNVSRIERGKMEFLFEPSDVEELAKLAYEQLIPMAENKKLKLRFSEPKTDLPKIMADKEKLRQVMNNLIDNAIKYTKAGTVDVKISQQGDEIRFEVKDSGKGISKEDRENIFQKYTRGKESIKQSAGLGLGLYVAKIIIEQHKGRIWAESEGEGKGSTFIFTIPIHNDLQQTTLVDLTKDQKPQS